MLRCLVFGQRKCLNTGISVGETYRLWHVVWSITYRSARGYTVNAHQNQPQRAPGSRRNSNTISKSCSDLIDLISTKSRERLKASTKESTETSNSTGSSNIDESALSKAIQDYRLRDNGAVHLQLDQHSLAKVLLYLAACGESAKSVQKATKELLKSLDEAEFIGTLDLLTQSWTNRSLRINDQCSKYMEIALLLLDGGDSPQSAAGVNHLKSLFCPHHRRTHDSVSVFYNKQLLETMTKVILRSTAAKDGRRLNFLRKWLLQFLAEWTAVLPPQLNRINSLRTLAKELYRRYERDPSLYKLEKTLYTKNFTKSAYLSVYFWPAVIRSHPTSSLDAILRLMASLNVTTNVPEIQEAIILKQPDIQKCEELIADYEAKFHRQAPLNIVSYIHGIKAMNNEFSGIYSILRTLDSSSSRRVEGGTEKITLDERSRRILQATMRGASESHNYRQIIALYRFVWLTLGKNISELQTDSRIENYYITALAWTGQEDLALENLHKYWHRNNSADPNTVYSVVRGLIARGRCSLGGAKKPTAEKYSTDEIISKFKELLRMGISISPVPFFSDMFVQLGHMDINYKDLRKIIFGLCQAVAEQEKHRHLLELKMLQQNYNVSPDTEDPHPASTILLLDSQAIKQIVWLGFYKSPKEPWSSLDLLREIYQIGIEVPLASVVNAFAQIVAQVYAPTEKGPTVRIGQQMGPDMTVDKLIRIISEKCKLMP